MGKEEKVVYRKTTNAGILLFSSESSLLLVWSPSQPCFTLGVVSELIWANSQWSHLLEDLKPCFTTQDGEFELSLPEILVLIIPKLCNKAGRTAG